MSVKALLTIVDFFFESSDLPGLLDDGNIFAIWGI